jgi:type II secretion system protein C
MKQVSVLALVLASLFAITARTAAADRLAEPEYVCHPMARDGKISVQFGTETSVLDLVTWVSGFTCKNFVIDAEARARVPRVTIVAPNKMTPKQAMQLFVDAVQVTGLVVEQKKDTILIKLGPKMPRNCPAVADATPTTIKPVPPTDPDPQPPVDEDMQKLIDQGIKKIDDTHVQVSRALLDAVLMNPMAISKGMRVVPAVKDGKPNGFKLYAIRPSSVWSKVGFQNGDTMKHVNGMDLTSADKALEVYTKLRDGSKFSVEIERRGKTMTLEITIK